MKVSRDSCRFMKVLYRFMKVLALKQNKMRGETSRRMKVQRSFVGETKVDEGLMKVRPRIKETHTGLLKVSRKKSNSMKV